MKPNTPSLLRLRLLLLALLPVTVVALGLTSLLLNRHFIDLTRALEQRGVALARQTAAGAEFAIFAGNRELLDTLAESLIRTDPDVIGIVIKDAEGEILARRGGLNALPESGSDAKPTELGTVSRYAGGTLITEPVKRMLLQVDDFYSGAAAATNPGAQGHVMVLMSHQRLDRQRDEILGIAALLAIFGIGLGGALALVLARGISRPLLQATHVVERIGRGELGARMPYPGSGPLAPLAVGINAMAWRLDVMQDDLRAQVAEATAGLRQQKEAAEAATLAKSRFLAAASHDLRQPLHALGLFVSRLSDASLRKEHRGLVARIDESVRSLQTLLEDLLDLSRLDLKEVVPVIEDFDAREMLQFICHDLVSIAERKQLDLHIHAPRAEAPATWVRSDPRLVERVMRNLIGNALNYTEQGGVLVACRQRGNQLRLAVWDTGRGIPAERQEDIFHEYVQIGNEERQSSKGLGLGLSICRHIASVLQTTIGLRSTPGRGSVFWMDLPSTAEPVPVEPLSATTDEVSPPPPVVMIIGEPDAELDRIAEAIDRWGGKSLRIADRAAAVQRCRHPGEVISMAICDSQEILPLSGVAVGEDMRRECPDMAVLLLCASDASDIKTAAREAGFPLLIKPVPPGRLRAALRQMSAGRGGEGALFRDSQTLGEIQG